MNESSTHSAILDWAAQEKSITHISAVLCDLNGVYRGKKTPLEDVRKIVEGGFKLPLSTLFLDVWGRDALRSGQVLETGDIDGVLQPTDCGILPLPWGATPTALLPLSMFRSDGAPYEADPRQALAQILRRYQSKGMTPVCALELEFYLYKPAPEKGGLAAPGGGRAIAANALYDLNELEQVSPFIDDVYLSCAEMGVPAGAVISEGGAGQFEINLGHRANALRAADDGQLLKQIVKGVAAKHGLAATFMAKPYGDEAGNGLHLHVSVLNEAGDNIFDDSAKDGSQQLQYAVGGLLTALPHTMLVFAPHANSYRRLRSGSHAPTKCSWGYDNRTTAIRIPSGSNSSRRFEHRVAGADANPYLVMAAVLGAALYGMENCITPPAPVQGNAYDSDGTDIPSSWDEAIAAFSESQLAREIFSDLLVDVFSACKRQELETFAKTVPVAELEAYLETV